MSSALPGAAPQALWVFAYGSLMWEPGFPVAEARPGWLRGYHRAFCILSHRYRGTPETPGLVLGLDRGGSCRGLLLRAVPGREAEALDYLDRRELVNNVYWRRCLPVQTEAKAVQPAWTYVAVRDHPQYASGLGADRAAAMIARARGLNGSNLDYLRHTVDQLRRLGLKDGALWRLLSQAEAQAQAQALAMAAPV